MKTGNVPYCNDTCILVPSWDGYKDLWPAFFHCFFKYWPDCPFPVFLGANQAVYDDPHVKMVAVKPNTDYSTSLIEFLAQLPHTWVIVWVEDLLLQSNVDTSAIIRVLQWAKSHDTAHVRLTGGSQFLVSLAASYYPQSDIPDIGMIPKGARYRAGLTVGIWKKDVLVDLLQPGESAWAFEHNGTLRSRTLSAPFFSVISGSETAINVVNSVRKGLWTLAGANCLKQEGFLSAIETRKQESWLKLACFTQKTFLKLTFFKIWYTVAYNTKALFGHERKAIG